jgi:FkbM family methyltransferase
LKPGEQHKILLLKTVTTPSFTIVTTTDGEEITRILVEMGNFAPSQTVIVYNMLKDRCKLLDKNGKPPLVVDVGSHVGYFTLFAAAMGCRVIAIEAVPGPFQALTTAVSLNGFSERVTLLQALAGTKQGIGYSTSSPNWAYNHMLIIENDKIPDAAVETKQITLNDVINEDVLLLKIDAAGYEDEVLKGATQLLKNFEVENLLVETKKMNDVKWKGRFINEMRNTYNYGVLLYQEWYLKGQWEQEGLLNQVPAVLRGSKIPGKVEWLDWTVTESTWLNGFEEVWYSKDLPLLEQMLEAKNIIKDVSKKKKSSSEDADAQPVNQKAE